MQVDDRQEDDNRRQRRGYDRTGHFGSSRNGGLTYRQAFLLVTEDAFDHHNGIIHQHPGSEGQTAERHDIQRKMIEEHQIECGDNGNRDSQTDDQRRP